MGQSASDLLTIQTAPLMSETQQKILDQYLLGAVAQMQGFNLGVPYGGASTKSYTPLSFNLAPQEARSPKSDYSGGGGGKDVAEGNKGRAATTGTGGFATSQFAMGPQAESAKQMAPPLENPFRQVATGPSGTQGSPSGSGNSGWVNPMASILSNLPKANVPSTLPNQQLIQLLTSVFARPATYSSTGNYPKY